MTGLRALPGESSREGKQRQQPEFCIPDRPLGRSSPLLLNEVGDLMAGGPQTNTSPLDSSLPSPQRIHPDAPHVLNQPASWEVLLPLLPLGSHSPREARRTPLNNVKEIILIPA